MDAVRVKDLCYNYTSDRTTLKNVSFSIEKGSYTTIIGHNGSGKSTLAKLLLGLLEKKSGEIYINDLELNLDNLDKIRNNIGIVFQNPDNQFIGSTVRDDIAFGLENHCFKREEMDEIIEKFAREVNMTKFLESEPTKLSGGQKQRLSIARVFLKNPSILILDEATSALDNTTEAIIQKALFELCKGRTTIVVAHRLSTVRKADCIVVIDGGRIVEQGTHNELIEKGGVYKKLYESQFADDIELDVSIN